MDCKGTIILTGVGKSGFVAQKICLTLVSMGTKSFYLNPTDALHGDIGMASNDDILVMFSKSGASEELLTLVPYAKAKGMELISITSNATSKLASVSDTHVLLPLERELCPFDLAPVTSTAIQMLFGDTCAVAVMQAKRLTVDQYAMNHPAGRIGKRLILSVRDVLRPLSDLPLCRSDSKLLATLVDLSSKRCGCMLVVNDNMQLLGVFTDGDLRRKLKEYGAQVLEKDMSELVRACVYYWTLKPASSYLLSSIIFLQMTTTPRFTTMENKAIDALGEMQGEPKPVSFLPVVSDVKKMILCGLITLQDLVKCGL